MTPNDFTTAATAWIAAVVSIAAIAIPAYFKIKGMIDDLNAKHEHNTDVLQSHENRITAIDDPMARTTTNVAYQADPVTKRFDTDVPVVVDGELKSMRLTGAAFSTPRQGTGPVNPAPVGPLPDPQTFRPSLGVPQNQIK